jgi:hypothetical protein
MSTSGGRTILIGTFYLLSENQTHFCFANYPEPKASFFRKLYRTQWSDTNNNSVAATTESDDGLDIYEREALPPITRTCPNVLQNFQIKSGMGASLGAVMKGFYSANKRKRPYQLSKHFGTACTGCLCRKTSRVGPGARRPT